MPDHIERCDEPTAAWVRVRDRNIGRPRRLSQVFTQFADADTDDDGAGDGDGDDDSDGPATQDGRRLEQRAQLTPLGTAALVIALGILVLVVLAVGWSL